MNPSYMASMKAISTLYLNAFFGTEPKPVVKKEKETSINGRAFAPGHGVQQEVSSEEKEAKVRAHLDKLAGEAKARYLADISKYPTLKADVEKGKRDFPCSDMVTEANEYEEQRKLAKYPTIGEIAAERHRNHQAYIDRQIELNHRTELFDLKEEVEPVEPKYPTSDMIDMLHDHIAEVEAAELLANKITEDTPHDVALRALHKTHATYIERRIQKARERAACIHTGERMNFQHWGDPDGGATLVRDEDPDGRFEAK